MDEETLELLTRLDIERQVEARARRAELFARRRDALAASPAARAEWEQAAAEELALDQSRVGSRDDWLRVVGAIVVADWRERDGGLSGWTPDLPDFTDYAAARDWLLERVDIDALAASVGLFEITDAELRDLALHVWRLARGLDPDADFPSA